MFTYTRKVFKMKILHVVPSFVPCYSHGGVVNASYQIAKKQAENGHDVTVYTTDSCQERLKFEDNYNVDVDGIKVYYFKKRYTEDGETDGIDLIKCSGKEFIDDIIETSKPIINDLLKRS